MRQKAYITLVFSSLKCVLSKDLILVARCTETDLNKAKSSLSAFNETTFGNPPSRYREIQTKLANSVFYYRQAQLKEDLTETRHFLGVRSKLCQRCKGTCQEASVWENDLFVRNAHFSVHSGTRSHTIQLQKSTLISVRCKNKLKKNLEKLWCSLYK